MCASSSPRSGVPLTRHRRKILGLPEGDSCTTRPPVEDSSQLRLQQFLKLRPCHQKSSVRREKLRRRRSPRPRRHQDHPYIRRLPQVICISLLVALTSPVNSGRSSCTKGSTLRIWLLSS